jgi:hypothetical protein
MAHRSPFGNLCSGNKMYAQAGHSRQTALNRIGIHLDNWSRHPPIVPNGRVRRSGTLRLTGHRTNLVRHLRQGVNLIVRMLRKRTREEARQHVAKYAREHLRAHPLWAPSRAPTRSATELTSRSPRGTRGAAPWGSPWPPPECAPRGHSGGRRGRRRLAPRDASRVRTRRVLRGAWRATRSTRLSPPGAVRNRMTVFWLFR